MGQAKQLRKLICNALFYGVFNKIGLASTVRIAGNACHQPVMKMPKEKPAGRRAGF
jgi:hypothetical protein